MQSIIDADQARSEDVEGLESSKVTLSHAALTEINSKACKNHGQDGSSSEQQQQQSDTRQERDRGKRCSRAPFVDRGERHCWRCNGGEETGFWDSNTWLIEGELAVLAECQQ